MLAVLTSCSGETLAPVPRAAPMLPPAKVSGLQIAASDSATVLTLKGTGKRMNVLEGAGRGAE